MLFFRKKRFCLPGQPTLFCFILSTLFFDDYIFWNSNRLRRKERRKDEGRANKKKKSRGWQKKPRNLVVVVETAAGIILFPSLLALVFS